MNATVQVSYITTSVNINFVNRPHTHAHNHIPRYMYTHSVGTILAIPTSVVVDLLVQRYVLPWQAGIGIALIAVGFGGFVLSEYVATRREAKHEVSWRTHGWLLLVM